jgi:hypothetical protein
MSILTLQDRPFPTATSSLPILPDRREHLFVDTSLDPIMFHGLLIWGAILLDSGALFLYVFSMRFHIFDNLAFTEIVATPPRQGRRDQRSSDLSQERPVHRRRKAIAVDSIDMWTI